MKSSANMFEAHFFHAIFEVWSGSEMISKYSETETVVLNAEQSTIAEFGAWIKRKNKGSHQVNGREVVTVLTYADFKTDINFHDHPIEINPLESLEAITRS